MRAVPAARGWLGWPVLSEQMAEGGVQIARHWLNGDLRPIGNNYRHTNLIETTKNKPKRPLRAL